MKEIEISELEAYADERREERWLRYAVNDAAAALRRTRFLLAGCVLSLLAALTGLVLAALAARWGTRGGDETSGYDGLALMLMALSSVSGFGVVECAKRLPLRARRLRDAQDDVQYAADKREGGSSV